MSSFANDNSRKTEALSQLLTKLRPFQREAYDFATQGIVNSRQYNTTTTTTAATIDDKGKKSTGPSSSLSSIYYDEELHGKGRILLADEMGLGKTITALSIMTHYMEEWPLLILCPASLRYTWPQEIEKFIPSIKPSEVYIVQGFDDADFYENTHKRNKIKIVIATYSLLQKRSASAQTLQQFDFQCVIVDESHNLKQKNSQRTQLTLPLLEKAKRLVLLSGTPALARPVELWTQVYVIAPKLFGSYTSYTKKYCNARRGRFGWDVNGLSNADELHSKLKQIMIRRLKSDVLDELPPKQRSIIPITIPKSKRKECQSLIKELKETRQSVSDLIGDDAFGAHMEARKLLMQAYQSSGAAKVDGVCDYLLEWLRGSGTQKVLIFAHHKAVMDAIEMAVAKELKGGGHIRIDGSVNSQERAVLVRKFQTCSQIRVAVLSMTAAGVGLTLTAASNVMFAELHWTPGVLAQAEDRCHRISQKNAVNIMYLVCEDSDLSVDMQLWQMLARKVNDLGRVVDGARNSSMDAQRAEDSSGNFSKGGKVGGMSGQDELQSFFADTVHRDNTKDSSKKIPVKGTILSFFAKQKEEQAAKKSAVATGSKQPPLTTIEWDCEVCTFHNSRVPPKFGPLNCEMCETEHTDFDGGIGKQDDQIKQVTPGSSRKPGDPKPRNAEIIVLDDDEEDCKPQARRAKCSPDSPLVIDDSSPVSSRCKKKQKVSHHFLPTKVNREGGVVGKTSEHNVESSLLFTVSKNTGRVTVVCNSISASFEVEEIVTIETSDRMMEAKLSRKQVSNRPVSLAYEESSLQRGMYHRTTLLCPSLFFLTPFSKRLSIM